MFIGAMQTLSWQKKREFKHTIQGHTQSSSAGPAFRFLRIYLGMLEEAIHWMNLSVKSAAHLQIQNQCFPLHGVVRESNPGVWKVRFSDAER